jgi:hypothetical protein
MRTRSPVWKVVTVWTGVPKSDTSSRRRRPSGSDGFQELHHHVLALHTDIDTDLVVGQRHHDAPRAFGTTAEVQVLQRQCVAVAAFGEQPAARRARWP